MGRAYAQQQSSTAEQGDEDGLAHMHLDSFSHTEASHSGSHEHAGLASSFLNSSSVGTSESESSSDESADDEGDSEDEGSGFSGAPTFLLADGTPGIEGVDGGDDGGDGDGGDGDGD